MALTETSPAENVTGTDREPLAQLTPKDELALVGHVLNLFYRARTKRRPLLQTWYENYEVLHNRTWELNRAPWLPNPEVPECFPIIDAIISWMTDQQPTFDVAPACEPFSPWFTVYESISRDLRQVLRATWQIEDYDGEIEKCLWDAFTYGIGFTKSYWDSNLHAGLGNAVLKRVDPFTIYVDPEATCGDDMNHIIELRTMSAQELERRWPGALKKIGEANYFTHDHDKQPDLISPEGQPAHAPMANPGAIPPAISPKYGLPGQTDRISVDHDPGVTVFDCWLRTPVRETGFPVDPTDPKQADDHPEPRIYDTWRHVVIAGNRVLVDEPAEKLWNHGQHPYERLVLEETGEFYGQSMVSRLASCQRSINWLLAAMEQNIWLMGNPVFKEDTRAGISRQKITNKPGQRLKINPGGTAEWLQPPQMHPQMSSDLVRFYIGEMERISGLSAIVRGAQPTGRNAQGVIDAIQEAAFVRIRKAIRNTNRMLRKQAERIGSLIVEFYDTPRYVAMVGPSGETTSLKLHAHHFYLPSDKGRVPMRFQLLMSVDSSMPTSRQARAAEADALYAMGAIDEEAVLEAHDWPNRFHILQRVREMKAQQGTLGLPPGRRQASRA